MAAKKTASKKPAPAAPEEIGWTVRMPEPLAERVRQRAAELTALGRGKWTGNMVIVNAIADASKEWGKGEKA